MSQPLKKLSNESALEQDINDWLLIFLEFGNIIEFKYFRVQ